MNTVRKKLLVEGGADKRVIPYLMEANGVEWPKGNEPVMIHDQGSVDEILSPGVIQAELRATGVEALGVVVDADRDAGARWTAVRTCCRHEFSGLPVDIPADGLRMVHADGPRFGVWIMPDNQFAGMLEDFLISLMPAESKHLYSVAQACVANAASSGAPFKTAHRSKAELHTWLAWQDEPGKQLHEAVHHRVLDPNMPESRGFVRWFRELFAI